MRGKFLLVASLVIIFAVGGILFGTGSPVIEGIEIKGGGRIPTSEIRALSGLRVGQPFSAIQNENAVEAIQKLRLVQRVFISSSRSSLRGVQVVLDVREREPFAIVKLGDQKRYWIDRDGFLLDPAQDETFYPILAGLSVEQVSDGVERISPIEALETAREFFTLPGEVLSQFSELLFSDFFAQLTTRDGRKVRVPTTELKRHLERYSKIQDELQISKIAAWGLMDLRLEGEATLRR